MTATQIEIARLEKSNANLESALVRVLKIQAKYEAKDALKASRAKYPTAANSYPSSQNLKDLPNEINAYCDEVGC